MPNSLLEAMAMRLPAVAFGIPAVQEIDAGTGALCVVPPFDERHLADAILKLAASPGERQRLGEEGRRRVLDQFMVRNNVVSAADQVARLAEVPRMPRYS
jgi:glycosyltransferase involved in cell wall biosynthesis